ncbi:hypothetical protein EZS27_002738 [termite gut metagenome]|uniref:Uncharacterized protein n=1 Tax=termite gut metagenome TaxID=433724 RepID=A0A5J4SVM2_9ZZZZ
MFIQNENFTNEVMGMCSFRINIITERFSHCGGFFLLCTAFYEKKLLYMNITI